MTKEEVKNGLLELDYESLVMAHRSIERFGSKAMDLRKNIVFQRMGGVFEFLAIIKTSPQQDGISIVLELPSSSDSKISDAKEVISFEHFYRETVAILFPNEKFPTTPHSDGLTAILARIRDYHQQNSKLRAAALVFKSTIP